ncbi:glycosyltransferase involved in cell wall biosynthesis [Microbacterium halimionae]|uniref:Glycosyltransferase involved in cell wall biosynthesis n=1 Tax=Microbacterium halimionae TaxID=1526413 RepID=A0A7W3PLZ2_9MICO|nr:glycosyltransferase [Microbacterium halimionae]MBA8816673.1 glycosyltransferase involved in cell wall biosynthesis [Microbacterium halimionae]NII95140.1 glycosyltransferase involved in cell wall biosynthesis [Microbacterium halimionae]
MKSGPQVLVFPSWRENPYLNLLGLAPRSSGYHFLAATQYESLLGEAKRLESGDVLHMHWTSPLLQGALTNDEAIRRVREFAKLLPALRKREVNIVWTIHNRLPHEVVHRESEVALYRILAEEAHAIHIMNPVTPSVLSDICTLPAEKVRIIPHSTYDGIYSAAPDRELARESFGLRPEDFAVLFLGQIRPYKGVQTLIRAVSKLDGPGISPVLMLAGAVKETTADEVREMIPPDMRTVLHLNFVEDGDLARWLAAADVAAFPYTAILNSGSVHLAATYRLPVILPGEDHLRAMFEDENWVRFFDQTNPEDSIAEILRGTDELRSIDEAEFSSFVRDRSPWEISKEYLALLDSLAPPPRRF